MSQELKIGTILNGNYRIDKVLGQGGFGITYQAYDAALKRTVAIKEYFPNLLSDRDENTSQVHPGSQGAKEAYHRYKDKFLKEAQSIVTLNHPSIIRVFAAFEENDTAYYVMEYIDGRTLSDIVAQQGSLSVPVAIEYIRQVGEALGYIHARNMNHLDVKPANIMVRNADNQPILIDFGLSKHYDASGDETSTTPIGLSHGYAPAEQYIAGGVRCFSPRSDLYSLAATLYFLLSGETPPPATQLIGESLHFPSSIPSELRAAITTAMSPAIAQRHPSVAAFLAALTPTYSDATIIDNPTPIEPDPVEPDPIQFPAQPVSDPLDEPKKLNPQLFLWGGVGLAAIIALVLLITLWPREANHSQTLPSIDTLALNENGNTPIEEYGNDVISQEVRQDDNRKPDVGKEQKKPDVVRPKKEDQNVVTPNPDKEEKPVPKDDEIFVAVEQQAQFRGNVNIWLSQHLQYPQDAANNGIQGRVMLKFCVEKDGSVSQVSVLKGVDSSLDREAMRVVRSMPKWKPARNNGIVVRSWYTLPITFRLS